MAFSDFPGQAQGVELLQRSLERSRLAHAYLFAGHQLDPLEGLARTLAKTLNCLHPVKRGGAAVDCCDRCLNCQKIEHGNHADVFWVRPESKSRQIKIGQIVRREDSPPRVLLDAVNLKPTESQYKFGIVVAADRMNEAAVQWIDSVEWHYRRSFGIPRRLLKTCRLELVAEGLDTYATIMVNGKRIGAAANMFIGHRFDVTRHLRAGGNRIDIIFDAPEIRASRLEKKYGRLAVSHSHERVYVRKAQYSFGWDWGPKLTTSGIWRSIAIEAIPGARLEHPFVKVVSVSSREAVLELSVDIRGRAAGPLLMRTTVTEGTARRAFRRGGGALRGVAVAGKTGSLTDPAPYRDYSWFVGYAPVDHPEIAVATLVVNGQSWRVRAPTVAREALEAFFAGRVAATPARGLRTAKAPAP